VLLNSHFQHLMGLYSDVLSESGQCQSAIGMTMEAGITASTRQLIS